MGVTFSAIVGGAPLLDEAERGGRRVRNEVPAVVVATVPRDICAVILAVAFITRAPNKGHRLGVLKDTWLHIDGISAIFVGEAASIAHTDGLTRVVLTIAVIVEGGVPVGADIIRIALHDRNGANTRGNAGEACQERGGNRGVCEHV